jgi:hypothetical protein
MSNLTSFILPTRPSAVAGGVGILKQQMTFSSYPRNGEGAVIRTYLDTPNLRTGGSDLAIFTKNVSVESILEQSMY